MGSIAYTVYGGEILFNSVELSCAELESGTELSEVSCSSFGDLGGCGATWTVLSCPPLAIQTVFEYGSSFIWVPSP